MINASPMNRFHFCSWAPSGWTIIHPVIDGSNTIASKILAANNTDAGTTTVSAIYRSMLLIIMANTPPFPGDDTAAGKTRGEGITRL